MRLVRVALTFVITLAVLAGGAVVAPMALAAWIGGVPSGNSLPTGSSPTVSVDGNTAGLSAVIDPNNPDDPNYSGIFGGGSSYPDASNNELTTWFTTAPGAEALLRFQAYGAVEEITCSGGGTKFYQKSRVTLGSLPAGSSKVWAFYDATYPSGAANTGDDAGIPHFKDSRDGEGETSGRIPLAADQEKLCDYLSPEVPGTAYVDGTPGVFTFGAGEEPNNPRPTAGMYKTHDGGGTVHFDVYVPMEGDPSGATSIFLAMGFLIDMGDDGFVADGTDMAMETVLASKPWNAPGGDTTQAQLSACSSPTAANAAPCYVDADTGIFASDGTTSRGPYVVTVSALSDEAAVEISPDVAQTNGFSITPGDVAALSISWPTSGTHFGIDFDSDSGSNFMEAIADTKLLVDPATTSSDSKTNRWDMDGEMGESGPVRVISTLIGQARATSSAISRDTWWPQCNVTVAAGAVTSEKCGEGMTSNVSQMDGSYNGYMVFSSVPANLTLYTGLPGSLAGGLVSTNGQGMAFGDETLSGDSFQFAVSGPSYIANGGSRATDGFYYVCVPEDFLAENFDTNATAAAASWQATRSDGGAAAAVAASFATGSCGAPGAGPGLVSTLDPFGYSSPLFRVKPPTPASGGNAANSGNSGSADAAAVAPVVAPQAAAARAVAKFSPENFVRSGAKAKNAAALVGGKIVDVVSEVTASGGARVGVGAVTLDLAVAEGNGSVSTEEGQPALAVKRGSDVALKGGGLQPDSTLQVFVPFANSSFAELPSITVDAEGDFSVDVSFTSVGRAKPFPIGLQSLQLSGVDEDGNATIIDIPITIAQPDAAPEINRLTGEQPALEPGQLIALVAGAPENVEIDAAPGGAAIAGDGWSLELSGGVNQEANQPLTFAADQPARVSGDGFMGGTRADVFLFSTPTLLGSVTIADDGTFAADFDIDSALIEAGSHTLQIQGVGADGYVRAANLGVTVSEPTAAAMTSAEASTSGGMAWLWWVIGVMAVAGIGVGTILWLSRRSTAISRSGR